MKKIMTLILSLLLFINSFSAITAENIKNKGGGSQTFIKSILPIIQNIQNDIQKDREKVEEIFKKSKITTDEKAFLNNLYTTYRVKSGDKKSLLDKMIVPPTSLVIAQASLESAWGKSKVAQKSNNLFGMKSFNSGEPRIKSTGSTYYRKYESVEESIRDYVINLSRHDAYRPLRRSINNGEETLSLIRHLVVYGDSKEYPNELRKVIKGNNLTKYDS